jgi:undecaprenyl-diphosphatase
MYLWIGIAQCVAMIPGVSRSGASIVAAMLLGADKRSAAEFLVLSRDPHDDWRIRL